MITKQKILDVCFDHYHHIDKDAPQAERIFEHIKLVREWTRKLCTSYPQVDPELLDIAAIAHDIGRRYGGQGHAKKSVEMIKPLIADLPAHKQGIITESILKHGNKWVDKDNTLEVKILQSADALSVFSDTQMLQSAQKKFSKEIFENKLRKKFRKACVLPEGERYAQELLHK